MRWLLGLSLSACAARQVAPPPELRSVPAPVPGQVAPLVPPLEGCVDGPLSEVLWVGEGEEASPHAIGEFLKARPVVPGFKGISGLFPSKYGIGVRAYACGLDRKKVAAGIGALAAAAPELAGRRVPVRYEWGGG